MAMGLFVSRWISRLKADKHPAFAIHWLYWHLPASPMTAMRATPPSHIRRMVG
jgi:conjugal transfer pilus assembly protein TraL